MKFDIFGCETFQQFVPVQLQRLPIMFVPRDTDKPVSQIEKKSDYHCVIKVREKWIISSATWMCMFPSVY